MNTNDRIENLVDMNEKLTKMLNANYKANLELENEVRLLNAYLVEKGLAEKYCKWKKEVVDNE